MMGIFMLSLGGLPGTGGFIGKYFLLWGLFDRADRWQELVLLARRLGGHQHRRLVLLLHSLYQSHVPRRSGGRRSPAQPFAGFAVRVDCFPDRNSCHWCLSAAVYRHRAKAVSAHGSDNDSRPEVVKRGVMNSALPGAELIEAGLIDLREHRETVAALLVAIGAPRLRRLGFELPTTLPEDPEHRYCMSSRRKMSRIPRIRVTMLSFADW